MYRFDSYGWYIGLSNTVDAYTTSVQPPDPTVDGHHPKWTGSEWQLIMYVAPGSTPAPATATDWFIDIGPFFDRFGATKMAILTSQNIYAQALVRDLQARKWVDLKRADVADGIDLLISLGIPGVDAELKAAILGTMPTADEQLALMRLYFS